MRKKRLFQKVMGITITAVLTSSTCISPILAEDMIIEEPAGLELPASGAENAGNDAGDILIEEMPVPDGDELSTEGSAETEIGSDFIIGVEELANDPGLVSETEPETDAEAEEYKLAPTENRISLAEIDKKLAGNEEIPELDGINRVMYTAVKDMAEKVEAGKDDSTAAVVTVEEAGYEKASYTAEELGVSEIIEGATISEEAAQAAYDKLEYDPELVLEAVRKEDPEGLSWAEGTVICDAGFTLHTMIEDGVYKIGFSEDIQMSFQVKGELAGEKPYTVDLNKTKLPETEIAETESAETEAAEKEVAETEIMETEAAETEVAETEVMETEAAETEIAETEVTETELPETETEELSAAEIAQIQIKTQPKSVATGKGKTVEFSVEATGTGLTYQWQYRTSASAKWKNFASATTATIRKVTGDWDGWEVKCVIADAAGNRVDSDIAKISFGGAEQGPITITKQPKNITTEKGATVEFAVEAAGDGLTYQWQYRTSASAKWKNFAAATTATIRKVTGDWDGWQIKCVIADAAGNRVDSDIATISFGGSEQGPITITSQPQDVVTEKGATVKWSVEATGNNLTYQWQYRTSASGAWKNFVSAKTATIEKVTGDWDGWQIKCVIKDAAGNSAETNVVNVTFKKGTEGSIVITEQPKDVVSAKGETIEWKIAATGNNLTYQWQYQTDSNATWKNFVSAKTASIKKVAGDWNGWKVRCVVTDAEKNSVTSNVVTVTFKTQGGPVIVSQPKSVTAAKGDTVKFAVAATGNNLTYQWKYRTSSTGSWKNFVSAKTASIQKVAGDWDGWQVKCVVTDGANNSVESDIVTITFAKAALKITKQPEDVEGEKGKKVEFSVVAEGNGLTYQWQYRTSETGTWKKFASATEATLRKVAGDWDGWQVRCVIKDSGNHSVTTRTAKITFPPKELQITQQPASVEVQLEETAEFSVEVNREEVSYQWETRGAYQSEFVPVKDATGSTYSVKADSKNRGQVFRCVITDGDGTTLTSEEATLNIKYQNHTAAFVNAATNEIIAVAEAENFAATAGLQAGTVIYLPKDVKEQTSKPYTYYTVENGKQVPVNLEAVVEGSTASYDTLNLFFYVTGDVVVYVTV